MADPAHSLDDIDDDDPNEVELGRRDPAFSVPAI
jgi:hypothetical protein